MHVKGDSLHTSEIPLMCIFSLDISCNCVALPVKENQCENQNWVWIRQRFRMQKYDCKLLFTLSAWKTLNIRSSSTRFPNHLVDSSDPDLPSFSILFWLLGIGVLIMKRETRSLHSLVAETTETPDHQALNIVQWTVFSDQPLNTVQWTGAKTAAP